MCHLKSLSRSFVVERMSTCPLTLVLNEYSRSLRVCIIAVKITIIGVVMMIEFKASVAIEINDSYVECSICVCLR